MGIKNILINGENCKDLKAYFTRYVHKKLIKILDLHYHELMGTSEEQEAKKLFDGWWLDKLLEKMKEIISFERFYDTKILIDTDDKLPYDITFKNVVVLMTCVIKDGNKFYPQVFSEETLYVK